MCTCFKYYIVSPFASTVGLGIIIAVLNLGREKTDSVCGSLVFIYVIYVVEPFDWGAVGSLSTSFKRSDANGCAPTEPYSFEFYRGTFSSGVSFVVRVALQVIILAGVYENGLYRCC